VTFTDAPLVLDESLPLMREFTIVTPGALMKRSQFTCCPDIIVFATVTVHGPLYDVNVMPGGTPVFDASGNPPDDVEPDPELVTVVRVVDGVELEVTGAVVRDVDTAVVLGIGVALVVADADFGVKTRSA
jgi:hypothetical protein